jgi:hypothetical protein
MNVSAVIDHCYRIDAHNTIVHFDDQFRKFAVDNDAPDFAADELLGRDLFDFIIGEETRHLYEALFTAVRDSNAAVTVPFRCDSPSLRRFMELTIAPSDHGAIDLTGRLLRTESREELRLLDPHARRGGTILTLCSFCKHVLVENHGWVSTEQAVRLLDLFSSMTMPQLSHGVCDSCLPEFMRKCGLG